MRSCLEINTSTLIKNINTLLDLSGKGSFFCPMIKTNSYGHGALDVAKILKSKGFKKIGVVSVEEALELKSLSEEMEIYIFGPFDEKNVDLISAHGFIPVVGQWEDLKKLSILKKEIPLHIKFNLGMNRLGFKESETSDLIVYIQNHPHLKIKGLCSHLNEGEKAGSGEDQGTIKQISSFQNIISRFQSVFSHQQLQSHLLGSAGWWALWSHSQCDPSLGFRPGICLYGIKPPILFGSEGAKKKYDSIKLKEVSCLKSFVVQSHNLSAGQSVSYGKEWTAQQESVLAVVSMGYGDGLPYRLSNKTEVLFRGEKVPIVGRVCMDFFMIDITKVTDAEKVCRGEEVVIFGSQRNNFISIEEQARKADSIPYEILTGLGRRVHRVFL